MKRLVFFLAGVHRAITWLIKFHYIDLIKTQTLMFLNLSNYNFILLTFNTITCYFHACCNEWLGKHLMFGDTLFVSIV